MPSPPLIRRYPSSFAAKQDRVKTSGVAGGTRIGPPLIADLQRADSEHGAVERSTAELNGLRCSCKTPGSCKHESSSLAADDPAAHIGQRQPSRARQRIERGWILVNGTRQDDGTIELGTGAEMRSSLFEAISQREDTQITLGHILTASVQRLAFWRR